MNGDDVQVLVAARIRQAKETLQDARILLNSRRGTPRSIINRAYYASFYAVLALTSIIGGS